MLHCSIFVSYQSFTHLNRTFLINVLFLIGINVLIKPFYLFGIDRVVQNTVGAEVYGLYAAVINFTFLLQIISDFGIQSYNNKNIAQHRNLLGKYFPNIIILKVILAGLYVLVLFPAAWLLQYEWSIFPMILAVGINQILISLLFYMRSNVSGLGFYRTDSLLSALEKLLMILVCGILLYVPAFKENFRIEWFIYAQMGALLIATLTAYLIVRKHLPKIKWRYNPLYLRIILRDSYPYALVIFLMTFYTKIDVVMIERMLSDGRSEAGIYVSGYRLLDAVNMTGFLFASLLLPMFSRMLKLGESIKPLFKLSFLLIWSISIAVAANVWFFRNEISSLLYIDSTPYWGTVLGSLMLTYVAVSGIYISSTLITAEGQLKQMNGIFVAGIVINVILNFFLINQDGALGAAVATIITQSFVLLSQMILIRTLFKFKVNKKLTLSVLSYTLLVIMVAWKFYSFSDVIWQWRFVGSGGIAILLAIGCGMIQPRELKTLK